MRPRCLLALVFVFSVIGTAATFPTSVALAETNGVGLSPAMGWSSWSYLRQHPTASAVDAQAASLKSSGLARAGYGYVNVDDFWYDCPGSQGPAVDAFGRWIPDPTEFPASGTTNGIQAVANYVHSLGLKFGLYVSPGISKQAVVKNTPIEGTPYAASDIATLSSAENYNCGGMLAINYARPGAQAFINSWADEFADWGVDYLKLDGVGSGDVGDVEAWSAALQQSGRSIHLELSNSLDVSNASLWKQYANDWRTGGDIECYGCDSAISTFPLTDWTNVASRFDEVASWQPFGGPGGFNDYDALEIGNGSSDGLTPNERESQMSLWALASSPLMIGSDLTHLNPSDLKDLENLDVISVDQDSTDASRILESGSEQVFTKAESNGDTVVGIFNTGTQPLLATLAASRIGLPSAWAYALDNLWTHDATESGTTISGDVSPHGVLLYRITPLTSWSDLPPTTVLSVTPLTGMMSGERTVATEALYNFGLQAVHGIHLSLDTPQGWSAVPLSHATLSVLAPGHSLEASFSVTVGGQVASFTPQYARASGSDWWPLRGSAADHSRTNTGIGSARQGETIEEPATTLAPVQSLFETYSSASDAPPAFREVGSEIAIQGGGSDIYSTDDTYSAIYQRGVVGMQSTVSTEIIGQDHMFGYAKAGIMIRNNIAGSGTSPEGVILYESPAGGIQMEWDNNEQGFVNSDTPGNGSIVQALPVWLKLVRNGAVYTGYFSADGTKWSTVGSATVQGQASAQDAGDFMVSHAEGLLGAVTFQDFSVSR